MFLRKPRYIFVEVFRFQLGMNEYEMMAVYLQECAYHPQRQQSGMHV